MGYVRPKRAKRPANRPKWPSNLIRGRVWATCFFEIHDLDAFEEHFFNGLLEKCIVIFRAVKVLYLTMGCATRADGGAQSRI
ncbi:hypothetical protein J1N44_21700 [Acidovorax temperans]|uniref:hypothetical protein n=1 Tax=Acidovorax temperans TaxID=80878 RepID=UPI001A948EC0|nr:hypothetical protein [Acidovorax temperans]MBO0944222.1 hypothetical protein [Acidovorax temperans]